MAEIADNGQQRVWILREGVPAAIPVTVGATDGIWTEVTGGELQPNTAVVVSSIKTEQ